MRTRKQYIVPIIILLAWLGSQTELVAQAEEPAVGDELLYMSIYFGGGSFYISEEQEVELKEFIEALPNIYHYTISIHSHTDNIGGVEYNNWLSEMRGQSAIIELIENRVPQENIFLKDFGEFNPVFDNHTYMGRRRNRRVDIIFEPIVF